jgi:hypothetical protein
MRSLLGRFHRPNARSQTEQLFMLNNLGDGSTLNLDFTTGVLDSRLTFTRASDATFINSSGLVQYADANHVRNSTMLVSTLWTQTTTGTGATTINGDGSVRFNGAGGRVTWLQSVALAAGLQTTFSFRVTAFTNTDLRTSDLFFSGFGFTGQQYFYTDENGTTHSLSGFESLPKTGTNGLGVYSCTATTTGTSCNIIFGADCNGVGRLGDVTIRDPQVQYGTVVPRRAYVPNSSTISAKWDSARFDYDPTTLAPRGLLVEGQTVNLALRSDDFNTTVVDGTSWTASGYTAGTLSTTLPDGTTGNARRISIASGSGSFRSSTITVTASTAYTFSFWARNNGGSQARFRVWNVTAGSSIVDYTQSANNYVSQIGGANNTSSTWVRVSVQFTTPAGCTSIYVYPSSSDSGTVDLLVWGAQVETGSGASSYIPTGASTATRVADECVMTGTNFSSWFNAGSSYSMLFRYSLNNPSAFAGASVDRCAGTLSVSGGGNRTFIHAAYRTTSGSGDEGRFVRVFDTGSLDLFPATLPAAASNTRLAFAVDTNNAGLSAANQSLGTDSGCTILTGQNQLELGKVGSSQFINGCISLVKYWPTRLPNATLQSLTT